VSENVRAWWSRRQWSKGAAVPYPVGSYRDDWERYPVLARQFHPDLNAGIVLTQIPPAADVYLTWQCDTGHVFVATPEEQRNRPGRTRRRSSWCPECSALAAPRRIRTADTPPRAAAKPARQPAATANPATTANPDARRVAPGGRPQGGRAPGEAFVSERAPKPSSAAEGQLRHRLTQRLLLDITPNAVATSRPFFDRAEVWPDIVIPDLKVAIEYDTIGKFGLEHVGTREAIDRRKDRLLREVGWQVIRIRCGKLRPLGPHDVVASGVNATLIERVLDELRVIRGSLFVDAYLA
jgi:very-short-patch-repair endonuclease